MSDGCRDQPISNQKSTTSLHWLAGELRPQKARFEAQSGYESIGNSVIMQSSALSYKRLSMLGHAVKAWSPFRVPPFCTCCCMRACVRACVCVCVLACYIYIYVYIYTHCWYTYTYISKSYIYTYIYYIFIVIPREKVGYYLIPTAIRYAIYVRSIVGRYSTRPTKYS